MAGLRIDRKAEPNPAGSNEPTSLTPRLPDEIQRPHARSHELELNDSTRDPLPITSSDKRSTNSRPERLWRRPQPAAVCLGYVHVS